MDIENTKRPMKTQQYFSFKRIKDTEPTSEWTQMSRQALRGTEEVEFRPLSPTTWLIQKGGKEEVNTLKAESHEGNSELCSRNIRCTLDTWTKGSQVIRWGSRVRMESWGQATVGTETAIKGAQRDRLQDGVKKFPQQGSFLSIASGEMHHDVTITDTEECNCTVDE